ncbi:MAG: tRNA (adenosine(37)-N6)-threonylcarbamoyltransferase complex transferase subunit TsaD, partial [Verrucomicrobia bacterium]|nr:tRNA (adenosine(37)-N6)-threonylcarbamoyltransferase complex transferase subunit TsaD [Verrucomicrobiota bacterium]
MRLLALESSCDETSAAVISDGQILSNVVSSQIALHAQYGGVVPELATREHLKNLPVVTRQALKEAKITPSDLDAVAATRGPGLPGALLIGLKAGQSMARALKIPFLGVHHHEGHLYSAWISLASGENFPRMNIEDFEPSVALVVSGGHTLLVHVSEPLKHQVLGGTLDDAAGECFDKTAKLLGLPYPGGPVMDRLAAGGDPKAFDFPRPMLHDPGFDFSFSGLK